MSGSKSGAPKGGAAWAALLSIGTPPAPRATPPAALRRTRRETPERVGSIVGIGTFLIIG
ncbi:hypothetical protein GCM10028781_38010 [Nostocoides australiense]